MIITSHQTFSGQIKYVSGQIKFGQTNFLYIINGNFVEFPKENECPDNCQPISQALQYRYVEIYCICTLRWFC